MRLGRQTWWDSIHRRSSLPTEAKADTAYSGATCRAGKQSAWKGQAEDHVGKIMLEMPCRRTHSSLARGSGKIFFKQNYEIFDLESEVRKGEGCPRVNNSRLREKLKGYYNNPQKKL